jgi:hypothetical protein
MEEAEKKEWETVEGNLECSEEEEEGSTETSMTLKTLTVRNRVRSPSTF